MTKHRARWSRSERAQPEVSCFLADFAELMLAGSAEGVHLVRETITAAGSCYGVQAELLLLADQLLLTVTQGRFATTQVIKAAPGLSLDRIEKAKALGNQIRAGLPLEQARKPWGWRGPSTPACATSRSWPRW